MARGLCRRDRVRLDGALRAVRPRRAGGGAGRHAAGAVRHPELPRAVGRRGDLRGATRPHCCRRCRRRWTPAGDGGARERARRATRSTPWSTGRCAVHRRSCRALPRALRRAADADRLLHPLAAPRAGTTATRISCAACCGSWSRAATTCAPSSRPAPGAGRTCCRRRAGRAGRLARRLSRARQHGLRAGRRPRRRPSDGADVVIVHEWNEPALVAGSARCGRRRRAFTLLFHDTHHRAVSEPEAMRPTTSTAMTACWRSARRWPRCIAAGAGASACSSGTRRPTPRLFHPPAAEDGAGRRGVDRQLGRRRAHGGARGVPARAHARRSACRSTSTACATRTRPGPCWPATAQRTAAGCRTTARPRCSPGTC